MHFSYFILYYMLVSVKFLNQVIVTTTDPDEALHIKLEEGIHVSVNILMYR